MRQDVVTGLAISALVHAGVFFGSALIPHHPTPKPPAEHNLPLDVIQVAPLPDVDPEPQDASDTSKTPVDVAAPTLPDRPQVTTTVDIVQKIEPPVPDNARISGDVYKIPDGPRGVIRRMPEVFDPASLDQRPIARVQPPPQYPYEMRKTGTTGTVVVDFIVDSNGDVRNAYAARSTQPEFEDAAVQAVSKWKFKPGRKAGHAVNTHMQVPIVFSLDGQ